MGGVEGGVNSVAKWNDETTDVELRHLIVTCHQDVNVTI